MVDQLEQRIRSLERAIHMEMAESPGLHIQWLSHGSKKTKRPTRGNRVWVKYTGRLQDGTVFDSSQKHGRPFQFIIDSGGVIEGWNQVVQKMHVGDRVKATIPPHLAYGKKGAGQGIIPPDATLIFNMQLLKMV